ncbi:MAG TPA: RNA-binding S4 domain-containing protein [Denitromonas sp.]|uniref:RNA-binding S4 domain-containing protein n=1 Tax=Denitromonas sp. TaxID=2734609 RepID=UPI001DD64E82|nr:RNA-binding S4 domain-containing protein [Rhodocyclaceae bacterium]MCP5221908.1 RNA-binding S4 domain-containing protein [Zoogloeaceae bacterium]HPR07499.1 RNA-binding S4 domain-containing protein [Denitromonas sp.]HQU87365.1 RNA-binding S4 domain-containing protein [Denitromonas sp.]HQV13580.1 RNA-binding S4 domain-containing protein [Denitromonas sp.]
MSTETGPRIDKWLWAARFFKTRGLAKTAIDGGHIHLNGVRAKPARTLRCGDLLDITVGTRRISVVVEALSESRGSATVAQQLYTETPESIAHADAMRAQRAAQAEPRQGGRPTKRDRRAIHRFNEDAG